MNVAAKRPARAKSAPSSSVKADTAVETVELLQAEVQALRAERQRDHVRHRRTAKECEWLRHELTQRNLEATQDPIDPSAAGVDPAHNFPGAIRAINRNELPSSGGLFQKLIASLILKLARAAARRRDYASAEIYYQAILLLRPRPFIWRQTGNMLAGQGLYSAAVGCFEHAIALASDDAEAYFLMGVALTRMNEERRAAEAFARAIALQPELDRRPRN